MTNGNGFDTRRAVLGLPPAVFAYLKRTRAWRSRVLYPISGAVANTTTFANTTALAISHANLAVYAVPAGAPT